MADELLPYYNRELTYLRRMAAEFSEAHPKIAGRLRLSADAVEDPHVARLLEGVAFLNARISRKLDDEYPELVDTLLDVLYPHYLAPIPSMAVVQMKSSPDLTGSHTVPKGTELETEALRGETCRFRTVYPATLWPIELDQAVLAGRPLVAPPNPRAGDAVASLRLTLRCRVPEMTFTELAPDTLRFFLRGQPQQVYALHELLFNNAVSVALADDPQDPNAVILGPDAIRPVGFGDEEGMLPYPARSHRGYRLLTEYFAFPEKFLFFDLHVSPKVLRRAGNTLEIFIYLNNTDGDLERAVSKDNFALGCTPVVNLFRQRAEPVALTQTQHEHRVVPDARRPGALEVYSVDGVLATDPDGKQRRFLPFYGLRHGGVEAVSRTYYTASRRPAGGRDPGTEVHLALVDLDFDPSSPAESVLSVETTCLNRDLPGQLPYGGGHPHLKLTEGMAAVAGLSCLTPPTPTLRIAERKGHRWRLVSHLLLNHLSISGGAEGTEALREILRLYDFRDSAETRGIADGIVKVTTKRGTARAPSRPGDVAWGDAMCRGIDVGIEFDPQRFSGSGMFLLAMILDHFLGLYCSINSFTRLTATVKGRTGVLRTWPARAGNRPLL